MTSAAPPRAAPSFGIEMIFCRGGGLISVETAAAVVVTVVVSAGEIFSQGFS